MDWLLYDNGLRHERVKFILKIIYFKIVSISIISKSRSRIPRKLLACKELFFVIPECFSVKLLLCFFD